MYAVIKVAGKQHRVEKGRWFLVDQPEAQELSAEVLLVADGAKVTMGADAAKAKVKLSKAGTVRIRGERSMKFRPKQGRYQQANARLPPHAGQGHVRLDQPLTATTATHTDS